MKSTSKESIIYAYRLAADSGSAPCIYDLVGTPTGLLTLVCCKGGQIRQGKEINWGMRHIIGKKHTKEIADGLVAVYVMGIYKNKLLYIAEITKVLSMRDYFAPNSPYKKRHDYIYDALPDELNRNDIPKFRRNDNNPDFHPKGKTGRHRRDWLGKYALISDCFAYFGKDCKSIPEDFLESLSIPRGYKTFKNDSPENKQVFDDVKKFLKNFWNFRDIIQNEPHDYLRNQSRKGCGK